MLDTLPLDTAAQLVGERLGRDVQLVNGAIEAPVPEPVTGLWVLRGGSARQVIPLLTRVGGWDRLAAVIWEAGDGTDAAVRLLTQKLEEFGYEHLRTCEEDGKTILKAAAAPASGRVVSVARVDGRTRSATEVDVATTPRRVGIAWQLSSGTGWGVYGTHLATECLRTASALPVLLSTPSLEGLDALRLRVLHPALLEHVEVAGFLRSRGDAPITADFPVLHALGNRMQGAGTVRGNRNVGMIFFEDTRFDSKALDSARRFDLIIAGSSWNGEVLRGIGLDNVEVILQGVDPTVFHPAPRAGLFPGRFVVFSGGKLEYRKGQDLVVAAFREFRRRHADALLVTAWHNPWPETMREVPLRGHVEGTPAISAGKAKIVEWLAHNGIPADAVVDIGPTPNAMMGRLLREADVAVFPNRCEGGTNLVAMECMACGVPTILSSNTGHLDLVEEAACIPLHHQGPAIPTAHFRGTDGWGESSVEEILAAMEQAYQDRAGARLLGERASARMLEYSWQRQIGELIRRLDYLL